MSPWWPIWVALLLSSFAALSRQAIDNFNFSDAEEILRRRGRTRRDLPRLERFAGRSEDHALLMTLLDVISRAVTLVGAWVALGATGYDGGVQVLAFVAVLMGHVALHEILLSSIGSNWSEVLVLRLVRVWALLYVVTWVPLLPFHLGHRLVRRLRGRSHPDEVDDQHEDEILAAVSQGEYAGAIKEEEREMIESVLGLDELTVEKVMTPRTDMHAVAVEDGVAGVLREARESGHSRLPVYRDNRDNIIGVCYVKDLIGVPPEEWPPLTDVLRQPLLIPGSKNVVELLTEFRRDRVHLAIVLDEYGGTAGLVTIEDIVEEVFGDIEDEYDEVEEEEAHDLDEATHDLDAKMHVDEINERYGVNLPESDRYESLGGLLTSKLGCIPASGVMWENDGARLTVLDATERRVVRVRLEELGSGVGDARAG